ncbi:MAG: glycine cleavage system protein GcvH [Alphaproteobacteria bacterium]|nr:glycine cleavage system protein GcvH [Alphaproteobacteria bacterium]
MNATYYTRTHEYVRLEGETGTIGITDFAQTQLGDVVFVELPPIGATLTKGAEAATVESVKAAAEVNAPVSGEVMAVNSELTQSPSLVNEDPLGRGWFWQLRIFDVSELDTLLDEEAYQEFLKTVS